MIQACLSLLAGIYALQLSSFAVDSDLASLAFVAFLSAVIFRRLPKTAWFFLGVALFSWHANTRIDVRLDPDYAGDSMVMQVRIIDFPAHKRDMTTFVAEPVDDSRFAGRMRLSWYRPPVVLRLGDTWQFELRLRRPRGNLNPGGFDFEAWLFRSGISATGYVVDGRRNQLLRTYKLGLVDRIRLHFVERLARTLPGDPNVAVLAAISVGARHLLTAEQWDRFARTGTSHLMAISGLHIGLAAASAYLLASLLGGLVTRKGNHHLVATILALSVAVAYASLSGFAVPAQRASLMIGLAAVGLMRRRRPQALPIIALAAMIIAIGDPISTMAPGFKLSFAAVLILAWLARRHTGDAGRVTVRAVRDLSTLQIHLLFGLLPLTVLIFSRITFAAPPVNLFAVPVFSFVTVPATLIGLLLDGPFASLGDLALLLSSKSLAVIQSVIGFAAKIDIAAVSVPAVSGKAWLYLLLALIWVVLPPGWPGRALAFVGVVALLAHEPPRTSLACVDVDILDVGQGLAVAIHTRSRTLLYDTGPAYRTGGSAAESVILPYLASRGISRIDTLVVSHGDLDHAGGTAAISGAIETGRIVSSDPVPGVPRERCHAGDEWFADRIRFRFLHPVAGSEQDGNNASCVLSVEAGEHRLLLAGDIEKPAEGDLVRRGVLSPAAIVLVPHHGSRTSSSLPFVRASSPELAIVSAAFGNRWGFPKADVVQRWRRAGANVLDTGSAGAVSIKMCADTGIASVTRARLERRRIWHE